MMIAPIRLRQKIRVGTGIKLFAIMGPDEPIPMIPDIKNGISRPDGIRICIDSDDFDRSINKRYLSSYKFRLNLDPKNQ